MTAFCRKQLGVRLGEPRSNYTCSGGPSISLSERNAMQIILQCIFRAATLTRRRASLCPNCDSQPLLHKMIPQNPWLGDRKNGENTCCDQGLFAILQPLSSAHASSAFPPSGPATFRTNVPPVLHINGTREDANSTLPSQHTHTT